ncbi:dedicator of cytokinesis protein 1 [Trichonephila clavipes]|nr:dedicator of cytokinesis protein 1 [Trichonephila clavipes]
MRDSGFVTATVTGERYADMLQNRIIPSLADKHLLERTIFMQDGAPPHIARRVKDLLRRSFGDDRVLSRHFHHAWPQSVRLLALGLPEVTSVSCSERDFLDNLLRKVLTSKEVTQKEHKGQGLWVCLKLLHGDIKQVKEENPHLISTNTAIARKMGFPDIILPGKG